MNRMIFLKHGFSRCGENAGKCVSDAKHPAFCHTPSDKLEKNFSSFETDVS